MSSNSVENFWVTFTWYPYGAVLLVGVANAVRAGQNGASSRKTRAESLTAGLVVTAGKAVCLPVVGSLSERLAWPTPEQAAQMPWWARFGGAIIPAQFIVARQVGAAPFRGLRVTVGVITAIVLGHMVGLVSNGIWALRRIHAGIPTVAGASLVAVS